MCYEPDPEFIRIMEEEYRFSKDAEFDALFDFTPARALFDRGYDYTCFVSSSKGKGRLRKRPLELEFYRDSLGSWHLFPDNGVGLFDGMATEALRGFYLEDYDLVPTFIEGLRKLPDLKRRL